MTRYVDSVIVGDPYDRSVITCSPSTIGFPYRERFIRLQLNLRACLSSCTCPALLRRV